MGRLDADTAQWANAPRLMVGEVVLKIDGPLFILILMWAVLLHLLGNLPRLIELLAGKFALSQFAGDSRRIFVRFGSFAQFFRGKGNLFKDGGEAGEYFFDDFFYFCF